MDTLAHPCGVRPEGNRLYDQSQNTRQQSLGSLSMFDDQLLYNILTELDAVSLGRMAGVSRYLYCWSYQDDLWKLLALKDFSDLIWFGQRWRQAYIFNLCQAELRPFPVTVQGVYSDFIFQSWLGVAVDIQDSWLQKDNIDRVSQLSAQDFKDRYEMLNKPVVIRDTEWSSLKGLTLSMLVEQFPDQSVQAEAWSTSMVNYYKYAQNIIEDCPLYLFDKSCMSEMGLDYDVPEHFREDLFQYLLTERPDYRWLIAGPKKSGSSFHKDPNATSAWNVTLSGSKKWILLPPHITPPGVFPSEDGSEVITPSSLMQWFIEFYNQLEGSIETVTRAGDLIFVPSGWWHTVLNLEDTVAITQNFVSEANLKNVLYLLKHKQSHISGVDCSLVDSLGQKFDDVLPADITRNLNVKKPRNWFNETTRSSDFQLEF